MDEAFHEPCVVVNILLVLAQYLACGGQLEAAHLHKIVYGLDILNVTVYWRTL